MTYGISSLMRTQMLAPLEKFREATDTHPYTHTHTHAHTWRMATASHLKSSRICVLLATGGKNRWRKKMKTLKGRKRVKEKIGTEVHCLNPWGDAMEEIIILNQKPAILFGVRSSLRDVIYHRRAPSIQTWAFVIWLNNGYRNFYSNLICFKRWDNWNSEHV